MRGMKSIRGGKGLGDALYVQAVARHLLPKLGKLRIATPWPEVFEPLNGSVECIPFTRAGIDIVAHYSVHRYSQRSQWQDVCHSAGIREPVDLRIDWTPSTGAGRTLRAIAGNRKLLLVQMPRAPMDRKDGFGRELLPDCATIQKLINKARARGACIVQVGAGRCLHQFHGIDVDMANKTSVAELMDIALVADGFIGFVSFAVPLAESMNKRALFVWSRAGLRASNPVVRTITPTKILEKQTSRYVLDDATEQNLEHELDALL